MLNDEDKFRTSQTNLQVTTLTALRYVERGFSEVLQFQVAVYSALCGCQSSAPSITRRIMEADVMSKCPAAVRRVEAIRRASLENRIRVRVRKTKVPFTYQRSSVRFTILTFTSDPSPRLT